MAKLCIIRIFGAFLKVENNNFLMKTKYNFDEHKPEAIIKEQNTVDHFLLLC